VIHGQNPDYTQVDYQYDPAGRLLSRVTANGARLTQQFDANGWLTKLDQYDAANALVSSTTYTRDRVGNITGQTDSVGINSGTANYTLDALYRLTQADYPGAANDELFTYDKVGNRKSTTKGSLTANANTRYYNYTAGTNRLAEIRIGSTTGTVESSFTHDFEGRLTNQTGVGAKTLTWDAKGRVKTVGAAQSLRFCGDFRVVRDHQAQFPPRQFADQLLGSSTVLILEWAKQLGKLAVATPQHRQDEFQGFTAFQADGGQSFQVLQRQEPPDGH
jgi:YD repeat-containing protein